MKDQSKTKKELIEELVILRKKIAGRGGLKSDLLQEEGKNQQPMEGLGGNSSVSNIIRVSGINIAWNPDQGTCTFEDLPVAMMWVNTTLSGMMSGVQAMVGTERFFLALQSEGRKSVGDDWQIISNYPTFEEGFKAIANIAAVAGWGYWELTSLDSDLKVCRFRVTDNWEGRYQKSLGVCWGSGMMAGKLSGYCSELFGTNCWADQTKFIAQGDTFDEFVVKPSSRLIENEIENLLDSNEATRADMAVALRKLKNEVTERKRAEENLINSEAQLSNALKIARASHWEYDVDRDLFTFNDNFYRIFRTTAEEAGGYQMSSSDYARRFCHPDDAPLVAKETQAAINTNDPNFSRQLEHRILFADGEVGYIAVRFFIVKDQQGKTIKTFGVNQDITDHKRAEEEIHRLNAELEQRVKERTAELEALNQELEGFSYSISHDLRAPLRHLTGFANMLTGQMREGLDKKSRHYLDVISDSALKMGRLVDDVLSFSRMGRTDIRQSRLNPNILVQELIKGVEPEAGKRGIVWSVASLPEVYGDPTMIKIVFENLISNAVKYTRGKPKAEIEVGQLADQRNEDIFYVRDNGAGFDMEYSNKLFNLFQRLHHEEEFEGTGLGLANVKRIIQRHGGRVWAEGEVDRGATFYFSLPKRKV